MTQTDLVRVQPVLFADACQATQLNVPQRKLSLAAYGSLHRVTHASNPPTPSPQHDTIECAALVLGCGVAGNAAALRLANQGLKVTMLSASEDPHNSATYWAQGGIVYKSEDDSAALLSSDVQRAGVNVCDPAAVLKLATDGPLCVEELLLDCAKVPFARDAEGKLLMTLEASHNRARIIYKADHTGQAIATSMVAAVRAHPNITLVTGRSAFELVTNARGECIGALTVSTNDKIENYAAPFTLLATGGAGDLFTHTSNPDGARGEGMGLAVRAGAKLKNMQYVQFHPTTLFVANERRFLLTEALRGEGAILRDRNGRAFAKDYHPAGELAPRDVVSRLILAEMEKQQESCMFLDISHEDSEWLKTRFPTIYQHCLARGIDLTKEPMPVVPAAHYHCGGVEVDLHGATSVKGLYAAGEVACTGLHGANRLASTSLLEGLVWGSSAADHFLESLTANGGVAAVDYQSVDVFAAVGGIRTVARPTDVEAVLEATQRVMWDHVGPLRTHAGMARAVKQLALLEKKAQTICRKSVVTKDTVGLLNAVRAAKEIAVAAMKTKQSLGTHYIVPDTTQ